MVVLRAVVTVFTVAVGVGRTVALGLLLRFLPIALHRVGSRGLILIALLGVRCGAVLVGIYLLLISRGLRCIRLCGLVLLRITLLLSLGLRLVILGDAVCTRSHRD